MANSLQKPDSLAKQCEQLSQRVSNFNKTIEDAIASASNDMNHLLTSIKQNIEETVSMAANDLNEWEQLKSNLSKTGISGRVLLDVGGHVLTEPERKEEEESRKKEEQRKADTFVGDTLLSIEQKRKLNEFYGKTDQIWELLYKATKDGFESSAFHRLCDNQGPTIVIVRSTGGFLFGAYASQSWTSVGNYTNAPNSFLFLLTNANGSQPTKFLYNNNGYALYDNQSYGPTFGSGHDLHICDKSNVSNGSYCNFTGTYSYPNTRGLGQATFTGGKNFQTTEIEVFKLSL